MLWLNLAVLAVSLLGAGCTTWLLVGRRSVGARSRAAQVELAAVLGLVPGSRAVAVAEERSLTAPGLSLRHRAGCPLLDGRSTVDADPAQPGCGVCQP